MVTCDLVVSRTSGPGCLFQQQTQIFMIKLVLKIFGVSTFGERMGSDHINVAVLVLDVKQDLFDRPKMFANEPKQSSLSLKLLPPSSDGDPLSIGII